MSTASVHAVDEKLPPARLTALGLQHVLVMYAGAVAVPLIIGRALKLSPEQVAMLISADLLCCGIATLIQSLGQTSLQAQMRPINTPQMNDAYGRAQGLRELISQAQNANQTLIIADLPGTQSVALGAAMADTAELVPGFDNWPHPLGVVKAHETLGALVYYANEISEKKSKLKENAPALLLLDSNRLTPYQDEDTQFDNRFLAKALPADQLKQRGIQNILYVVKDGTQQNELDDLNEDFVEWQKQGIGVRLLRLSD